MYCLICLNINSIRRPFYMGWYPQILNKKCSQTWQMKCSRLMSDFGAVTFWSFKDGRCSEYNTLGLEGEEYIASEQCVTDAHWWDIYHLLQRVVIPVLFSRLQNSSRNSKWKIKQNIREDNYNVHGHDLL